MNQPTKPTPSAHAELRDSLDKGSNRQAKRFGDRSKVLQARGDFAPLPTEQGFATSLDLDGQLFSGDAARSAQLPNAVTNMHKRVLSRLVVSEQGFRRARGRMEEMSRRDRTANHALGHRISVARKRAGLTQRQLDDELGTVGQVTRWERGINTPSNASMRVLAELASVRLAWLLADEGPMDHEGA